MWRSHDGSHPELLLEGEEMTIPWLMNCAHSPDGWCLDCVKELAEERNGIETALDKREKQLIECQQQLIERNHELFLKNAAPQALLDGGAKDTLAAHPGASSPVVAARRIWYAGVPPQGEPES
jgi:hypothetical protein